MGELLDIGPNVRVQRLAIGEDENDVDKFLVSPWLEETVQPLRKPADRKGLATARRVINEVLPTDRPTLGEVRESVVRDASNHSALVVPREDGIGGLLWFVLFRLALVDVKQEEGQCLKE